MYESHEIDNTIAAEIPTGIIPKAARAAAAEWLKFYDKTGTAYDQIEDAKSELGKAAAADGEALRAAILTDKPDPGQTHQEKADKALTAAHRTFATTNTILRDKGLELLTQLRANRGSVYEIAYKTVPTAVEHYRTTVADAQANIAAAQAQLSEAYTAVVLLEQLDSGDTRGIAAGSPHIPAPDFEKGLNLAGIIESNLEQIATPLIAGIVTVYNPDNPEQTMDVQGDNLGNMLHNGWMPVPLYDGVEPQPKPMPDPLRANDPIMPLVP